MLSVDPITLPIARPAEGADQVLAESKAVESKPVSSPPKDSSVATRMVVEWTEEGQDKATDVADY